MVDGLQRKKPLVVVDLDGTLISGNSLHEYIKLGMKQMVADHRYAAAARIISMLVLRKLHIVPHTSMKWCALRLIGWNPQLKDALSAKLATMMRNKVVSIIDKYRDSGCEVIIATASFDFIASAVPGFSGHFCFSTRSLDNPHRVECRGKLKAAAVKKYLADRNMHLAAVLTDHYDDLPLLLLPADHRYLVEPSARTKSIVSAAGVEVRGLE